MAKRYRFRLATILKLRELKEKQAKMALGEVIKDIQTLKQSLEQSDKSIDQIYQNQNSLIDNSITALNLQIIPPFLKAEYQRKKNIAGEINRLEEIQKERAISLAKTKAEVKVLKEMEADDKKSHLREVSKKEFSDIEDIFRLRKRDII